MKSLIKILIIFSLIFSGSIFSQETQEKPENIALDLDQLLELVKQGRFAESEEAAEREARFIREKNRQARNKTPITNEVMPVLPPAFTPAPDST